MSHEMGHCLGLLHTHNGGFDDFPVTQLDFVDQTVQPGFCQIAGDCVCDTPADPNMFYNVTHPDCTWDGGSPNPPLDPNDDVFDPSTNSYSRFDFFIKCFQLVIN